jgi:hypothetical protein
LVLSWRNVEREWIYHKIINWPKFKDNKIFDKIELVDKKKFYKELGEILFGKDVSRALWHGKIQLVSPVNT